MHVPRKGEAGESRKRGEDVLELDIKGEEEVTKARKASSHTGGPLPQTGGGEAVGMRLPR